MLPADQINIYSFLSAWKRTNWIHSQEWLLYKPSKMITNEDVHT